jgi:hypothetical protein
MTLFFTDRRESGCALDALQVDARIVTPFSCCGRKF